jgi:hypothetical protein
MRFSKSSCTFVSASRCMAEAHASSVSAGGIKPIQLPARSPNLNAYAERWVRSAKEECLSKLILFGEASLRRALTAFIDHYHQERNHRQEQRCALPCPCSASAQSATWHPLSRAPRRLSSVLQSRRMNILTKRVVMLHPASDGDLVHCKSSLLASNAVVLLLFRQNFAMKAGQRLLVHPSGAADVRTARFCGSWAWRRSPRNLWNRRRPFSSG